MTEIRRSARQLPLFTRGVADLRDPSQRGAARGKPKERNLLPSVAREPVLAAHLDELLVALAATLARCGSRFSQYLPTTRAS